ncbi:MAG TPA: hypothetical protein VGQ21_15665 [Thermoanaerobaculia bacterium]|nr:hypothetical protein [Thermoanaerobaculia bacterium]
MHYHAFAFFLLAIFEAISPIHVRVIGVIKLLLILGLYPYLTMALRRVYGGGRWLTIAKSIAILSIYFCFVLLTMAAIAYITLRRL